MNFRRARSRTCALDVDERGNLVRLSFALLLTFLMLLLIHLGLPVRAGAADYIKTYDTSGGIKLTVDNSTDLQRIYEPVTSGIPLSKDLNITNAQNLYLVDSSGYSLPAQFRVLSRWGDISDQSKPIKWVLVDFQANVSPRSSSVYYLKWSGYPQSMPGGIAVYETAGAIQVNTGAMRFDVPKSGFDLFTDARLIRDYVPILNSYSQDGFIIKRNGKVYKAYADKVSIEERGPFRTVILINGRFVTDAGEQLVGGDARMYDPTSSITPAAENYPLTYSLRIHAYRGKTFLKLAYTLQNNGNTVYYYYPTNDAFIDGHYLKIKPTLGLGTTATVNSQSTAIASTDNFRLYQTHVVNNAQDEAQNFRYDVSKNGSVVSSGTRSSGWMDVSDASRGIAVGSRHFWQNYPKSIEYSGKSMNFGIFPDQPIARETSGPFAHYSTGNYYFSGGWHKTTEIYLYFHTKGAAGSYAANTMNSLTAPLFARCDAAWYADSMAWGVIAPEDTLSSPNVRLQHAFMRYEQYEDMFVDAQDEQYGRNIAVLRETRNQGRNHYGWEDFGDAIWQTGLFCSLHYDWPYIMWLQFMRSGRPDYLELALQYTQHSADMDQLHYYKPGEMFDGLWHWEDIGGSIVNYHHKSTQGSGYIVSHTWNGGYTLGYLMTGDNRYLEAASRSANAGRYFWSSPGTNAIGGEKVVFDQTRSQGWTIMMLINEYKVTGNIKNLTDAMAIWQNSLLYTEQQPTKPGSGGKGYITVGSCPWDPTLEGKAVVTFISYPLEPLCELHYEASRAGLNVSGLEAYLIRSLNWLKNYAIVGGKTVNGKYSLLTITYGTDPVNLANNTGGEIVHNMYFASAFGYMFQVLKDRDPATANGYLVFARNLFKDVMLYKDLFGRTTSDFYDPNVYAPIGWGWMPTCTKELGYIGRAGQYFLRSEYELLRTGQVVN